MLARCFFIFKVLHPLSHRNHWTKLCNFFCSNVSFHDVYEKVYSLFLGGVQVLLHIQEMYFIDYVVWIFCIFTDFLTPDETWTESGMF